MTFDHPQSLYAHGLALFRTIFSLVFTLFNSLVRFYSSHPEHDSLRTLTLALECLTAFLSLEYTLHSAPERITPRQLLRLAKASRALTRLTGQTFDFTPWTSLSSQDLSDLDRLYPPPTNPYAEWRPRPYELRLPSGGSSGTSLLLYPGATLANVIKKLARILPPDFTPEAFTPTMESPSPSPSPSPSCSQSELELVSQSQSRSHSHSQSTSSIASVSSIPQVPNSPCPQVPKSPCPQVPNSPCPQVSPSPCLPVSRSSSAPLLADPALSPALKSQISNLKFSSSPRTPG